MLGLLDLFIHVFNSLVPILFSPLAFSCRKRAHLHLVHYHDAELLPFSQSLHRTVDFCVIFSISKLSVKRCSHRSFLIVSCSFLRAIIFLPKTNKAETPSSCFSLHPWLQSPSTACLLGSNTHTSSLLDSLESRSTKAESCCYKPPVCG